MTVKVETDHLIKDPTVQLKEINLVEIMQDLVPQVDNEVINPSLIKHEMI